MGPEAERARGESSPAPRPPRRPAAGRGIDDERAAPEPDDAPRRLGHAFADVSLFAPPALTSTGAPAVQRDAAGPAPYAAAWIVEDEAVPGPGQMRRAAFLAAVDAQIHASADRALAPIGRGSEGCPYILRLLARVSRLEAVALERLARAYATPSATSAQDYLQAVDDRITRGVAHWIATGVIPPDAPNDRALSVGAGAGVDDGAAGAGAAGAAGGDAPRLAFARAAAGAPSVATPIGDRAALRTHLGAGAPLPDDVRGPLEEGFGADLGAVRVHRGPAAAGLARDLAARAVTVGDDVAFAAGAYRPESATGLALLAHEVAHTLQQRGASGPIAGFGDPSAEREADAGARVALARAHAGGRERPRWGRGGLRLQRCSEKGTSPDEPGPTPTTEVQPPPPPPKDPQLIALEAVKELTVSDPLHLTPNVSAEAREADLLSKAKDGFNTAVVRLGRRTTQIDAVADPLADKVNPSEAVTKKLAVLARMKSRWVGTILTDGAFDPATGAVAAATAADLRAKLADDKTDAAAVGNSGLTDWVDKLDEAVNAFLANRDKATTQHGKIVEEAVEFQRFNDLFLAPDVLAALRDANADFRPADLKAMLAKETGDFTNTAIAGLEGKPRGITSDKANTLGPSFIGIAQMNTDAKTEALKRATKLGITVVDSDSDDAREDPARAIKLAALYVDQISHGLPSTAPTGVERKKLILAAYNGGPGALKRAIAALGTSSYTWDDIVASEAAMSVWSEKKQKEVKDYVARIIATAP